MEHNDVVVSNEKPSGSFFGFSIKEIMTESKKHLFLGTPIIVTTLMVFLLQTVSTILVGHLGTKQLAAASMAISFTSVTGFAVLKGMVGALDTFCGQSYGIKDYKMVGIHMQTAALALLLVSLLVSAIWANTGTILLHIGVSPSVSSEAGRYSRLMIPSVFGYPIQISLVSFLQSQRIVKPIMIISAITIVGHCIWSFFLVLKSSYGTGGAAIGFVITVWFNTFMLLVYVGISSSCKNTRVGFSREAVNGIPAFMRLAFPSAVMFCLEFWSFETTVLLSAFLPNPVLETAALSICFNTVAVIFMIPLGFSSATSTLVSNELGAGNPRAARLAVVTSLLLVVLVSLVVAAAVIAGRGFLVRLFSSDSALNKYVPKLLILVGICHIMDAAQCILSGVCRGSGKQKYGAIVNLLAYYVFGIPLGVILAFKLHLGGRGFWIGIIVAVSIQTIGMGWVTFRTNWEREAKRVKERNLHRIGDDDALGGRCIEGQERDQLEIDA